MFGLRGELQSVLQRTGRLPCHTYPLRAHGLPRRCQIQKIARRVGKGAGAWQPKRIVEEQMGEILEVRRTSGRRDQYALQGLLRIGALVCRDGTARPVLGVFAAAEMMDQRTAASRAF